MNKTKNTVQAMQLPVNKLRPFEGHPFQVKDDAEMDRLVWSILTQGLLTPISVCPIENNGYEVISGHRRLHACKKAGIETVPALIYALDRDEATIAMVDSNMLCLGNNRLYSICNKVCINLVTAVLMY